jgi:hypothetical protein
MTNLPTRAGWIENVLKRVESRLGSDSEAAKSLRRDLDWARERDAEDAEHALRYPVKPPVVPFDPSMTPVHRMDVDYREGSLVKHTKRPDWGVGTVIADSTRESVRVLFEDGEKRTFGLPLAALVKVNV